MLCGVLKEGTKVMSVNWKKLESRMNHVERIQEPGRFLLGVLSVLVELLRVYKVLRKSAEELDTLRRSLMNRFNAPRLDSESVGCSGSGWHKSTNYPRDCGNLLTFSGSLISSPELRRRFEEFRTAEEASEENCRLDRKSTRLNSSHSSVSRMPSSA